MGIEVFVLLRACNIDSFVTEAEMPKLIMFNKGVQIPIWTLSHNFSFAIS